jgi:hypothetical protein
VATLTPVASRPIADVWLSANTSFTLPLYPSQYFTNQLTDGLLTSTLQYLPSPSSSPTSLPAWMDASAASTDPFVVRSAVSVFNTTLYPQPVRAAVMRRREGGDSVQMEYRA